MFRYLHVNVLGAAGVVLGGLAHETGLLNPGIVVSGAGITATSRYQQEKQIDYSLGTYNRLSCMQGRLGMITPVVIKLAGEFNDPTTDSALHSAPEDAIRHVEYVQHNHLAAFYSLRANVPSKSDLMDYFGRYNSVQATVPVAKMRDALPRSPESEAAAKLVRTLSLELEACAKLT